MKRETIHCIGLRNDVGGIIYVRSPGLDALDKKSKHWLFNWEGFTNTEMLKAARFVARWNGYELVKKKEKK